MAIMQLCLFLGQQLIYVMVPFQYLGKSSSVSALVKFLGLKLN